MRKQKQRPTKKQRIRAAIRNLRELGYGPGKIRETIRRLEKSMGNV